jgi:hypothetical protein
MVRPEHYRDETFWGSHARGDCCGQCGKPLARDEPAYRGAQHTVVQVYPGACAIVDDVFALFCVRCATALWPEHFGDGGLQDAWDAECRHCGRRFYALVSLRTWNARPKTRRRNWSPPSSCSKRCANALNYRGRVATRRPTAHVCAVCGRQFEAKRRDAKSCGPACRQKALRRRRAAKPTP